MGRMKPPEGSCPWSAADPLLKEYHDREWGVPQHDDRVLFEHLLMESMSCGLSWLLMLCKRRCFARNFSRFDYAQVAGYDEATVARIMADPEMIHAERKVRAVVDNARRFLDVRREFGSFAAYVWSFTDGRTVIYPAYQKQRLTRSALSDAFSGDLRRRGFKFVGTVSMFSFLEACGMINDHLHGCFRCGETRALNKTVIVADPDAPWIVGK